MGKKQKIQPKKAAASELNLNSGNESDMATSASHEPDPAGLADLHRLELNGLGDDGSAPSTAALANYLKGVIANFQRVLDSAVKSVVESVKNVERALEFEGRRITDLETQNKDLEMRLRKMETEHEKLLQKVATQEAEVNKAERYSRRNNFRVVGIPETTDAQQEDCIKIIEDILKAKFGKEITVERAHRDGKKGTRPRHIIAKLLSYREKAEIMKNARSALKDEKYYITDDMTKGDLEVKKRHAKEVQELYKKGTKLRFYAGQWRGNGGAPYFV